MHRFWFFVKSETSKEWFFPLYAAIICAVWPAGRSSSQSLLDATAAAINSFTVLSDPLHTHALLSFLLSCPTEHAESLLIILQLSPKRMLAWTASPIKTTVPTLSHQRK